MMAGIYYWIVIHEGTPLMAFPAVLAMLFLLRTLIRGWLRRPPALRRTPGLSGSSQPIHTSESLGRKVHTWDALATLATQQADQSRQSTEAGTGRRPIPARRAETGRTGYSGGRNAAADDGAVDTPGS